MLGQCCDHFRGALHDPDWIAAPLHRFQFTRRETSNIHFHRRTGGLGALGWLKCGHKGTSRSQTGHAARRTCGDEQAPSTAIDLLIVTHTYPNQSKYETRMELLATLNYNGDEQRFKANRCLEATFSGTFGPDSVRKSHYAFAKPKALQLQSPK